MSVSLKESYDIAYDGSENAARMDLFIDTSADLTGLTHFDSIKLLQGSTAEDISTGDKYMMQTGGTWVLQPSSVFTSNYYTKAETDGRLSAHVCTCDTAAGTVDKVATTSDDFVLRDGAIIAVKFKYTNSATDNSEHPITINVNNTGSFRVYYDSGGYQGQSAIAFGSANKYIYYVFNNNRWVWSGASYVLYYSNMTQAEASAGTATTGRAITAKVLHDSITEITDHKAAVSFTPTPIVSLLNCTFTIPDSSRSLRFTVGKLNATQNYLQIYVNGVDKGYIIFDVSRNIDDWGE